MKRNGRTLAAAFLAGALIASALPVAAQEAGAFKVGAAPPPQEVYTKVNLTEPYNIIEGFTIYPSLTSPDLFYYVPKPRVARTEQGRLVFRLLSYAMAENKNQVGSADVAGGYLQFDVTMSPNPDEEKAIKQQLLNPPKRFATTNLQTGKFLTMASATIHPYAQTFGAAAKPKNIRLAPIPIHNLKARARIPGVTAADKTETDWYDANGDASGTTTFALNLSGPQSIALYQAIMNPAAVEPFNVYFSGDLGGYIKCKAKLTVKTSEIYNFMQSQEGSATRIEKPGSRGVNLFGIIPIKSGSQATSSTKESQVNNIDLTQILNTSIKIEGDLQGYDDALMAMAKYACDQAIARFGTPIPLDELIDPKHELREPNLPAGTKPSVWGYAANILTGGLISQGGDKGRKAYYGYFDQKTLDQSKAASFTVDLNKEIAVTWQFSPSSSIFDDSIIGEIQKSAAQYAQKLALNDPFFEKLDITYTANLDFAGGPFTKVVFTDLFKLKDGSNYSVPGLLLESKDFLSDTGVLLGAAPPQNMRFGGLLQGNLYQGDIGGSFNILNPGSRLTALRSGKWPKFADGTEVKGISHRWKYTVYFRPSVKDNDFPPSWTSPEATNSETVLAATIPPKIALFTVTGDGLDAETVRTVTVKVKYTRNGGDKGSIIKSAKLKPGAPDVRLYFFDEDPKTDLPCEYQYTLIYAGGKTFTSPWKSEVGGLVVPVDPGEGGQRP